MAEYGRGIKAGLVAGIVYGILLGILISLLLPQLFGALGIVADILMIFAFPFLLFFGIIGGMFFGLSYAILYDRLPGSTSIKKGIVLALIMTVISFMLNQSSMYSWPTTAVAFYIVFDLIASIVYGMLVGMLWDRFGGIEPGYFQAPETAGVSGW